MPTGLAVSMLSELVERSPPRLVFEVFEAFELVAEKMMSELAAKSAVGVPVELLDQLRPASQAVPFEPSQ